MAWDGSSLWVCDLFGGQLLRINPDTGEILRRYGPDSGIAPPDDLVVLSDGTIIYTSPSTGIVGKIPPDGAPQVLARRPTGINPIALAPGGTAVVVGYGAGDSTSIERIDIASGSVETVATGLPALNGFSFGPDGRLWAPSGGVVNGLFGRGGVLRLDLATGATESLPLSFPTQPGKEGFAFSVSAKWSSSGHLRVLEGFSAAAYDVSATGVSTLVAPVPGGVGDNQAWTPEGRYFMSGFFGRVFEVLADGSVRELPIHD